MFICENLRIEDSLSEPTAWDGIWKQHFWEYQTDHRHAYYIVAVKRRNERRMLEIAAGSFRDMAALNRWGFFCEGVDFSLESVERARKMLSTYSDRIRKMDAACMVYCDGAFDLTFHNGFWGYFDDAKISVLAREQSRVTASRMIAIVHNAHNQSFKEKFAAWGQEDSLYRIRFFYADEIASLMRQFCRRVAVLPVGGGWVDRLIHFGLGPKAVRWAFRLYGRHQSMEARERLMCIGEVG